MWLRCVKSGSRIIYHDAVLLRYRVRGDSLSADPVWMYDHARRVLLKMRTTVALTDEERHVLESATRRFEGQELFHEGKRAFIGGDTQLAINRLEQANAVLKSIRIRMILFAIRTMPRFVRAIYRHRLHRKVLFAWSVRREVS